MILVKPVTNLYLWGHFVTAYTHLEILRSIVEPVILGTKFEAPQKVLCHSLEVGDSIPLDGYYHVFPILSLFCVCLVFGPNSYFGAKGMYWHLFSFVSHNLWADFVALWSLDELTRIH